MLKQFPNQITASPLLVQSLDKQIRRLGGRGFNNQVKVTDIPNSFSKLYEFDTQAGPVTLRTLNQANLAQIHADNGVFYVVLEFDDQGGEQYYLSERRENPNVNVNNSSMVISQKLGKTYDQMRAFLGRAIPASLQMDIPHPTTLLAA